MDEGWTRWVLEQYGFDPKSIDNKTIRAGKLNEALDVLVLPDVSSETIATGKPRREEGEMKYFPDLPPEYSGGLEKEGAKALRDFVEGGGTLVALASSTEYVLAEFNVPVRNVIARAKREDFSSAGSLLKGRRRARTSGHVRPSGHDLPSSSTTPWRSRRRSPAPRWNAGSSLRTRPSRATSSSRDGSTGRRSWRSGPPPWR